VLFVLAASVRRSVLKKAAHGLKCVALCIFEAGICVRSGDGWCGRYLDAGGKDMGESDLCLQLS